MHGSDPRQKHDSASPSPKRSEQGLDSGVQQDRGLQSLNLAFGSAEGLGGSERRMLDVVRELTSRGILVRSFAPGSIGSQLNAAMASAGAHVTIYRHPATLALVAAKSNADATWAFGARAALPLLVRRRLPKWRGGRLLVAKNGLEALRSRRAIALERRLLQSADLVVANSRAAADQAVLRTKASPERVRVLPSALSSEWMARPQRVPRPQVRIAMIGNDRPEKQHALGVRVFKALGDPSATLAVFTNDGTSLRNQLSKLDQTLAARVTIHEGISVTPNVFRTVDVLLHPSSSESLPRVALEARSQAVWVVGFEVGDLAQYCEALVPWGDADGLTSSLSRCCEAVRSGTPPPPIQVLSVSNYTDRLLSMIESTSHQVSDQEWGVAG